MTTIKLKYKVSDEDKRIIFGGKDNFIKRCQGKISKDSFYIYETKKDENYFSPLKILFNILSSILSI